MGKYRILYMACACLYTFYCNIIMFYLSYVGNLDPSVTEELLVTLFGQLGACKGCKLIHEVSEQTISVSCYAAGLHLSLQFAGLQR
jgi:uncharacterized membrane protein YfcA